MSCLVNFGHTGTFKIRKGLGLQALGGKEGNPIEFDCRKADCGICLVRVIEGSENLSAKTDAEKDFLKASHSKDDERLACQTNILGNVSLNLKPLEWNSSEELSGIKLSAEACKQAKLMQAENKEYEGLALRLYLDGKGCDGFTYGVTFHQADDKDTHFLQDGVDIVVDPESLLFTDGSLIEWVDDERGKGFLVENPNQKSYRGKFYKQDAWKKRLMTEEAGDISGS